MAVNSTMWYTASLWPMQQNVPLCSSPKAGGQSHDFLVGARPTILLSVDEPKIMIHVLQFCVHPHALTVSCRNGLSFEGCSNIQVKIFM